MTMSVRVALACVLCCPAVVADGSPGPPQDDIGLAGPARGRPGVEPQRGTGWWKPDPNRNYIVFTTVLPASFAAKLQAAELPAAEAERDE